jgi:hypothetical protein
VNEAFVQDQCPEASTVDQTTHNTTLRKILQILARLAKACATHDYGPDEKFPVYEVVKRDTGGCNVTPGVRGAEPDSEPLATGVEHAAEKCLDGLCLDQRDFAPSMARSLRIVARPGGIPVAF